MAITMTRPSDVLDEPPSQSIAVDARPILVRTPENAWERTEQLRADLYELFELACHRKGMEALVLQSYPYVHPAWVKFESWLPVSEPGVTARASITVTITARPYHRFEAVYKVDWEKHGQKGTTDKLYRFGDAQVEDALAFLAAPPAPGLARRRVRRLLKPVQLRQRWFELWKPRNKVTAVRRDWWSIGSLAALVAGTALLVAGAQDSGSVEPATFSATDFSAPPLAAPVATTAPPAPAATAAAAARTGSLDLADPRLEDGRIYEALRFEAEAGRPFAVTMRSADFDTYLVLGETTTGSFTTLLTNDDGGGGTDSRLEFLPPRSGEYIVLFSSYQAGRTGSYSYTLE
jgi:hypothetical protein